MSCSARSLLPLFLSLLLLLPGSLVLSGEVNVTWNSSETATGYRLYRSTTGEFSDYVDVGNSTEAPAEGLDDCTTWHFAASAYNDAGESALSSHVSTWPRAVVVSASPDQAEPGSQLAVVVSGINFQPGDAITFGDPSVQIDSVSYDSCSQLTLAVTVAANASQGAVDLHVTHASGVSGVGADLFSVALPVDETPPIISDLSAVDVGGTSANIVWSTDELANGQVFYRKSGDQDYQSTSVDPELTTEHAMLLSALQPETTYEFHVSSTDASNNTTTTSPDETFSTTESPYTDLRFESESGVLVDPMRVTEGPTAFGGAWIDTPTDVPQGSANNPAGTATFGVNVPEPGSWFLWVRMYSANSGSNTLFESVDGSNRVVIGTSQNDVWVWVAGQQYELGEGLHEVELGGREGGARADRVLLTNDPTFVPIEEPGFDIVPPQGVTGLELASGMDQIDLSWTNPADPDFVKTIVRFRTDGKFPTSPVDGWPLVEQTAEPGSPGSHVHEDLSQETTYSYSLFAIDSAGNVSAAVTGAGTPAGPPPAAPSGLTVF